MRKEGNVEIDRRGKETCNDMQVGRERDRKPDLEMKTRTNHRGPTFTFSELSWINVPTSPYSNNRT